MSPIVSHVNHFNIIILSWNFRDGLLLAWHRRRAKLISFRKVMNNLGLLCLDLFSLVPRSASQWCGNSVRITVILELPACSFALFRSLFIPSTSILWSSRELTLDASASPSPFVTSFSQMLDSNISPVLITSLLVSANSP